MEEINLQKRIIELSPNKMIKGALTVWNKPGPGVDLTMDLKNLTFADNSLDGIFAYHVLDHFFPEEVPVALSNWMAKLKSPKASLFVIVDDFEFIARSLVGGDLNIDMVNENFNHPTQFTRDNLIGFMEAAGFNIEKMSVWFETDMIKDFKFKKEPYELAISAEKS